MEKKIAVLRLILAFLLIFYVSIVWRSFLTTEITFINVQWSEQEKSEILSLLKETKSDSPKLTKENSVKYRVNSVFSEPAVMAERPRKLKKLRDHVYSTLDKLQNEGECDKKKIVKCHNSVMSGFGSSIHRHVICLHIALALDRAFVIDHDYKSFNGLASFTRLESEKCNFKKIISDIKENEKCNFRDGKCYLDDYNLEIDNSYKLLEFTNEANFPAPRYIPGTLPSGLEKALVELNIKKPWHWYTSQLLGYMVLRANSVIENDFSRLLHDMNLQQPLIGVHIRRGDKIGSESHFIHEREFYRAADHWIKNDADGTLKNMLKTEGHQATIFVASGDRGAVRKIKRLADKTFKVVGSPTNKISNILRKRVDQNEDTMKSILIDLYILLHCDYAIVTYSSNIGRLLWELKTALYPYTGENKIKSLDAKYAFYGWYDYTATEIYYLAKRSNNNDVTIGTEKLRATYEIGKLYHIYLSSRKMISFKNGTKVEIARIRLRHGKNGWLGYASLDDFIRWPGKPKYFHDV